MSRKKEKWDGRSRPSDDNYRKRWNEIFGKKEQEELGESYKQSLKNKKEREKTFDYNDVKHDHVNKDHANIKDKDNDKTNN